MKEFSLVPQINRWSNTPRCLACTSQHSSLDLSQGFSHFAGFHIDLSHRTAAKMNFSQATSEWNERGKCIETRLECGYLWLPSPCIIRSSKNKRLVKISLRKVATRWVQCERFSLEFFRNLRKVYFSRRWMNENEIETQTFVVVKIEFYFA